MNSVLAILLLFLVIGVEKIAADDTEVSDLPWGYDAPPMPPPPTGDINDEDTENDEANGVKERSTDEIKSTQHDDTEISNLPWGFDAPPMPPPPSGDINDEDTENDEGNSVVERSTNQIGQIKFRRSTATYDYALVLELSMDFYEAQRSGPLPAENRVTWRGDSALDDMGFNYEDLTGGYYDAGDHVKFGLPMAFTTTTLAWGAIRYKSVYEANGQLERIRETIKWATDYFIKAHVSANEFYSQVGDGSIDHKYWVAPETMTMERPPRLIDANNPGADVAGETAAALAAASIVFAHDPEYSEKLLSHAIELFYFGNSTRGCHNSGGYYAQSKYGDELAWAAAWLYKASNDPTFLVAAESLYYDFARARPWAHGWAEKNAGVQLLLYELTGTYAYEKKVKRFVELWYPGNKLIYTPDGLVFRDSWGPLRYAAGTCMIALMAAENGLDNDSGNFVEWATGQLHYMLGDNSAGQSFVIGFGDKYPMSPHHRASSCTEGLKNNAALSSTAPNPNLLLGALVGGPDKYDQYTDDRKDYVSNEVACDYNAAFQTAIAGLQYLHTKRR